MTRTAIKKTILIASLASTALFAQLGASSASSEKAVSSDYLDPLSAAAAPYIIFSNLDRSRDNRYNSHSSFIVAGRAVIANTEEWQAIRFVPKVDVRAKILSAAIGYASGTRLVNLGIYDENANLGTVGTLLPGGQGSTTGIPDMGVCCDLATVTLADEGVLLTAGLPYWLVASPDNVNAPTFNGVWHLSNPARSASIAPPGVWSSFAGQWPAAQVRGTIMPAGQEARELDSAIPTSERTASRGDVTVFTNLDRKSAQRYSYGSGFLVSGVSAAFQPEVWQALPFTPREDVRVESLAAAIAYVAGDRKVNLGIYSDSVGMVGTPLPGGQGSTTEIPDLGSCCELTRVRLSGSGVTLTGGTQYWLVASPDNVDAPTFQGAWQQSILAVSAYQEPERFLNWTSFSGGWLAAEIRGTRP